MRITTNRATIKNGPLKMDYRKAGKAGAGNKPGSVEGNHSSGTAVTGRLEQPTRESARNRRRGPLLPYLVLLRAGFTVPRAVTGRAVRSYRTFSPLPANAGGLFSVALSMGSHPPGVTWRPVRRSPDFPPSANRRRLPGRLRRFRSIILPQRAVRRHRGSRDPGGAWTSGNRPAAVVLPGSGPATMFG